MRRHVGKWTALVMACALPLLSRTWNEDRPALHLAELLGVAIWIVVMVGLDKWLLRRGGKRASRALGLGALTFAIIQGVLALVSLPVLLYIYYLPVYVILSAGPAFLPAGSPFAVTLIFTMACGMNALLGVLLLAAIWHVAVPPPGGQTPRKKIVIRVAAVVILVLVSYGVGFFQGSARLALVLQAANVASDMSGTWERTDTGSVDVVIRHYEHHAWYVLVGAYADPRGTVEPILGARVARQIRSHGDERDWVLYTVLDDGRVLPAVDLRMKAYEKGHVLSPQSVVVVKNERADDSPYQRLEVMPGQVR